VHKKVANTSVNLFILWLVTRATSCYYWQ